MALQAKRGRVYAVERQEDALALLARNKAAFSAGNLEIVSGTAPAACEALPAPTHVFLGGTAGNLNGILDAALRKNPHVRIGIDKDFDVHQIAEILLNEEENALEHDNRGRMDQNRFIRAVMHGIIVNRHLDGFSGFQLENVLA